MFSGTNSAERRKVRVTSIMKKFPAANVFDQILNAFGKVVITVIVMLKLLKIILKSAAHTVEP